MTPARPRLALAIALTIVAGCSTPPATRPTTPRASTAVPVTTSKTHAPQATSPAPAASLLPSTQPIVPTPAVVAAATLVGKVKAPAGLLSNNGANLISDHGSGIVSNNGAGYRLAEAPVAPEQFFVPNAKVELVDAAGQPLKGPDGQPFATTTGPDGSYRFAAALPTRHFVVRATMPELKGSLRRLVAPGVDAADVDLGATLVAGYILDRYVGTQADPQATLDRLPADVEARTAILADAVAAKGPLPDSLEPVKVVEVVTSLRRASGEFDGQMDTVKRLLIPAGVANLGVGLPANQLYFRRIDRMNVAGDGTVYAFTQSERVLWRFAADGTVSILGGTTNIPQTGDPASRNGLKADAVNLDYVSRIWSDVGGRPAVREERHGIWRLEADGTCKELFPEAVMAGSTLASGHLRADGTMVYLTGGGIHVWAGKGAPTRLADAPNAPGATVIELAKDQRWLVVGLTGATTYEVGKAPVVHWARTDIPATLGTFLDVRRPNIDEQGNVFYVGATDRLLHRQALDGTDAVVVDERNLTHFASQGLQLPDGRIFVLDCGSNDDDSSALIRRLSAPGGALQTVAGLDGVTRGFSPSGAIPLLFPTGLDVAPDGTIYVADDGAIVAIPPTGGAPRVVLARGTVLPAANEALDYTGVRLTAAGKLVVRGLGKDREVILRETAPGTYDLPISLPDDIANHYNITLHAWDVAPDGTIWAADNEFDLTGGDLDRHARILRVKPGAATPEEVVGFGAKIGFVAKLALGPDGLVRVAYEDADFKAQKVAIGQGGAVTPLAADAFLPEAADPEGRAYAGDAVSAQFSNLGDSRIRRQALSGAVSILAGKAGAFLAGTGLGDSIGMAEDLRFDAKGNLYFRDAKRRLVRKIPADLL